MGSNSRGSGGVSGILGEENVPLNTPSLTTVGAVSNAHHSRDMLDTAPERGEDVTIPGGDDGDEITETGGEDDVVKSR